MTSPTDYDESVSSASQSQQVPDPQLLPSTALEPVADILITTDSTQQERRLSRGEILGKCYANITAFS